MNEDLQYTLFDAENTQTEAGESVPVQYREGRTRFMDMDVFVDERVLIPRPETELLVSVTAKICREKNMTKIRAMDVGTGSGIVSMGLKKLLTDIDITAVDVSSDAVDVALKNIEYSGLKNIQVIQSDMFSSFGEDHHGKYDFIVSNPPYVSSSDYEKLDEWVKAEPRIALYAGKHGMDYINILAERSGAFLKKGGFLAIEIGYDQAEKTKGKLTVCGFKGIRSFKDFNGYERVIVGWYNG